MTMKMLVSAIVLLVGASLPARAELPECACSDFDKLQQELENATTLRDRHKAKAEELEKRRAAGDSWLQLGADYAAWEQDIEHGAGAGIKATVATQAKSISYVPVGNALMSNGKITDWSSPKAGSDYGSNVYDPVKAKGIEARFKAEGIDLCEFSNPEAVRQAAEQTSFCKGVAAITKAHEDSHRATCRDMGFIAFFLRNAAELARDEVKAYDGQIAALKKALGSALKNAEVQFEDESKVVYSGQMFNFAYTFNTEPTRAKIPDNEDGAFSASLKGIHRTKADAIKIAGMSCSMTPFSRDVEMELKADGKVANITFRKFGGVSSAIKCPRGGGGGSSGPDNAGESVSMPFKLQSTKTEDVSKSKLATMMAGVAKVSGKTEAKLQIICPAK